MSLLLILIFLVSAFLFLFDGIFETLLKQRKFRHQICNGWTERIFGAIIWGSLNANHELVF